MPSLSSTPFASVRKMEPRVTDLSLYCVEALECFIEMHGDIPTLPLYVLFPSPVEQIRLRGHRSDLKTTSLMILIAGSPETTWRKKKKTQKIK